MRQVALTLALVVLGASPALADKPPVSFVAANPRYYRKGRAAQLRYVVIHTIEGSAGSGINTFRSGGRKVSAHYIIDFNGAITQMVKDSDTAWHAGRYNSQSIGLEHAGWSGRNKWTMAQYRASARLTRWICDTYGVPIDRRHIVGHKEVPGATHGDPGRYFDWDLYIRLVRGEAGASGATPGSSAPPTTSTTAPPTTPTAAPSQSLEVRALRPASGELIGKDDVAADLAGLNVDWALSGGAAQQGARVLLEEVGGALRYDSGYLSGAATRHRVTAKLAHGRTYRWRALAFDGATTVGSAWTTFRADFTGGQVVATFPEHGAVIGSTPALRWRYDDPEARQVSYRVWIDDDADHSRVIADTRELNGATGYYYVLSRLQPGRTYHWRVMSYDGRGNQSFTAWQSFRTAPTYVHTAHQGELTLVALSPLDGARVAPGARPTLSWAFHSGEGRDQQAFQVQLDDLVDDGRLLVDETYAGNHAGYRPAQPLPPGRYRWRVRVWDGRLGKGTTWNEFVVPQPSTGLAEALNGN